METFTLKNFQYIDELLPTTFQLLPTIASQIKSDSLINPSLSRHENLISIWSNIKNQLHSLELSLLTFCEEEWKFLEQYQQGHICTHSLAAACAAASLPQYENLDYHDQNIIIYGLIFHDIAKKGSPAIKTKDPQHPFTSAAKTLVIFYKLGWIQHTDQVQNVVDLLNNAYFFQEWGNFMDNSKLPQIYQGLLYATGVILDINQTFKSYFELTFGMCKEKLFVFEIIAVILFHQSVDLDPKYPNFTPLSEKEILFYLSPRLLRLVTILHMGDNGSYNLPLPFRSWTFPGRIWKTYLQMLKKFEKVFGKAATASNQF